MLSIVSGIVITGVGGSALWACLPRKGETALFLQKPPLDSLIPVVIMSALALGLALIISGAIALF